MNKFQSYRTEFLLHCLSLSMVLDKNLGFVPQVSKDCELLCTQFL